MEKYINILCCSYQNQNRGFHTFTRVFNWEFYAASLHRFDPPGKMSAGMSCEVGVTFKPVVSAPQWQLCRIG